MNKKGIFFTILLLVTLLMPALAQQQVVPAPNAMGLKKEFFTMNRLLIQCPYGKRAMEVARFFCDFAVREKIADSSKILINPACAGNVVFRYDTSIQNREGYRLQIDRNTIWIEARTDTGLFWGVQTLCQIILTEDGRIPCVEITDQPRYAWRSNMLDCSRHFFPVNFLKHYLDILSFYKINVFHWHLTDDQGWRVEIRKYPELTARGAWRKEADGEKYGGYYTQEEIREIVEYARIRNIMVVPEIEMPGHCSAALSAFPSLCCRSEQIEVPANFGIFKDVFCAGREETLDEVIALFPSPYIHIGGDEVPKDRWKECARCSKRIADEKLKDESGLQSYFIRRMQSYLKSKGKTVIGWDEILEGGADRDALIEVWRGKEEADKALKNGNKIIQTVYFDASPAQRKLEDVFFHSPVRDVPEALLGSVIGSDCPVWTEFISEKNALPMLLPRLLAFSEVLWTGDRVGSSVSDSKSMYDQFRKKLPAQYKMLRALGVEYGPEDRELFKLRIRYDISAKCWYIIGEKGMEDMFFTMNHAPGQFADSIKVCDSMLYRVYPVRLKKALSDGVVFKTTRHKALGKKVDFQSPYSERYPLAGSMGLTDGILGSGKFGDGTWLGWWGKDLDATIDMEEMTEVKSISVNALMQSNSWIMLPRKVRFYSSVDGKEWDLLNTLTHDVCDTELATLIHAFECKLITPVKARYIRVVAFGYGKLPIWHNGSGGDAWIFADEIIVK